MSIQTGDTVRKEEVEALLHSQVTNKEFDIAVKKARKKQQYIYDQTKRSVVLEDWYLVKLAEEFILSDRLSNLTADICEMLREKESSENGKEHAT